jgi:hypothetical protein
LSDPVLLIDTTEYVYLEQKQTNFYDSTSKVLFKGIGKGIMKSGK